MKLPFRTAAVVLFVLGLALATAARAQSPAADTLGKVAAQYRIDGWQSEQGLPLNTVQSLYQARDGGLWVGTGGGLARFDGVRFTTFEASPMPEPAARPIFGFMEDREGALWIGHSRGASRYRNGAFERVLTDELMQGRRVWAFVQDASGVVWAATENGLARWERGSARLFKEADGLPTRRLRTLVYDKDGTLWIGTTGGGLVAYANGRFTTHKPDNGFPHLEVRHLIADPSGGIWAATAGAGLVRVGADGKFRQYTTKDGLPTDQLTSLARDPKGTLWIGTWGGGIVRMADGAFSTLGTADGLAGDQIWTVFVDREGSVWVGTWDGGLNRVGGKPFPVLGKPEGLAGDNVRSVIHSKSSGTWITSAGGGVTRIEGGRVSTISKKQGLPTEEVSTLFEDRDGAVWIATYTGGISRWKDGRIETFGLQQGVPNVDVRVAYRDRAGTLWIGTASGLARFDGKAFVPVREPNAPAEGVAALLEDRKGTLWIGTTGDGLVRYRNGAFDVLTRKDGLASNWVMALHEDDTGTLWIGTNGEGITRHRDGKFRSIRFADGLWDGLTQVILDDGNGHFWMTCNRGFFRVARAELNDFADGRIEKVRSDGYGPGDALRSTTFAGGLQAAGARDANGRLWLPSLKGVVIVDPKRLPGAGVPSDVSVWEVMVNGSGAPPGEQVIVPPGYSPLSIRYAVAALRDADRVRFRYRMDGITRDWVNAGRSREASFPTLPPGSYTFHVAASFDGRQWQEAPQPLSIVVRPQFFQTWWFLAAVLFAMLAGAAGLYRVRTRRLEHRAREMEDIVAAKTEELRVANEHLSRLSFADALTGLANRRRLDETLDTEWRRAARQQSSLAIVIADIDAFKAYNDALGHPEGDKCLIAVSNVIRESTHRAADFAARYGGEEFAILLPATDHAAAVAFAEGLRRAVESRAIPHPASSVAPHVTMSLGVAACVPTPEGSALRLFTQADAALYRAKQEGRNRVR